MIFRSEMILCLFLFSLVPTTYTNDMDYIFTLLISSYFQPQYIHKKSIKLIYSFQCFLLLGINLTFFTLWKFDRRTFRWHRFCGPYIFFTFFLIFLRFSAMWQLMKTDFRVTIKNVELFEFKIKWKRKIWIRKGPQSVSLKPIKGINLYSKSE